MRTLLALAAALSLATAAEAAPSWRDFPAVSNTSFVEASGRRGLQLSIRVPARPAEVWTAISTDAGWMSWDVPFARMDLRVGGIIETSYSYGAKPGDPNNIKNQILAYVPGRMLAVKNIQAPRGFADPEAFSQVATVIELEPDGADATKVTLTAMGYGQGKAFDELYAHFEWGDAYTLNELKTRFETGPVDWAKVRAQEQAAAASRVVKGQ